MARAQKNREAHGTANPILAQAMFLPAAIFIPAEWECNSEAISILPLATWLTCLLEPSEISCGAAVSQDALYGLCLAVERAGLSEKCGVASATALRGTTLASRFPLAIGASAGAGDSAQLHFHSDGADAHSPVIVYLDSSAPEPPAGWQGVSLRLDSQSVALQRRKGCFAALDSLFAAASEVHSYENIFNKLADLWRSRQEVRKMGAVQSALAEDAANLRRELEQSANELRQRTDDYFALSERLNSLNARVFDLQIEHERRLALAETERANLEKSLADAAARNAALERQLALRFSELQHLTKQLPLARG